ncbi:MAG: ABC transporter substrate-binding protein [Candidatus Latescibacteria bacterium]|nr:ABC transporter substrate-binding protein [Candidatus Latescibacterota bacterium]
MRPLLLWSLLALLGCGGSAPPATGPAVLRIGWAGSPDALHPGTAVLSQAYTLFNLVYDSMFRLELDGSFTPVLARQWQAADGGRTWTFALRAGFVFHDGQPLTARDVAFSYNFYRDHPDFPLLGTYSRVLEEVRAPNDSTVVIRLREPVPDILSQLVFLYVLPEHVWAPHAQESRFSDAAMTGSGPFSLKEYQPDQFVRLAATRRHPLYPPQVDEVIFQTFANQDALVQALRTGQVELITEMPNTAVAALRQEAGIQVAAGPPQPPETTDILINQLDPAHCPPGSVCSGHPALRDRRVRQALAMAVDKQKLIEVVLLGMGTPGLTLIPEGLGHWYNSSLQDYAFDPGQARALLEEAGYRDGDGDGVRELPDHRPLEFRFNWPSDSPAAPRSAQLLAAMWKEIGVATQLQSVDPDALTAACCPGFDYDLILWAWDSDPDPGLLLGAMQSGRIPAGTNETGYANPEYDALYQRQAAELDPQRRQEQVWELQRLALQDVVYIVPYYAHRVQAWRTDHFTGWPASLPKVALEHPSVLTAVQPRR